MDAPEHALCLAEFDPYCESLDVTDVVNPNIPCRTTHRDRGTPTHVDGGRLLVRVISTAPAPRILLLWLIYRKKSYETSIAWRLFLSSHYRIASPSNFITDPSTISRMYESTWRHI